MAGQLRASAALSLVTLSPIAHASTWNSSYIAVSHPLSLSYDAIACRGSQLVAHRSAVLFQSSFWNVSPFEKDAWMDVSPRNGKGEKKKVGVVAAIRKPTSRGIKPTKPGQFLLIGIAYAYLTIIVIIPFITIFFQAFSNGVGPFIQNLLDPDFQHAVKMTLTVASIVVPINTVFGLVMGIWITRYNPPFKSFITTLLDLPLSISPIVVGLMLMLLYGREGIFAPLLKKWNIGIVFALPGMVLATCFVSLPYVVRQVIPALEEVDHFQEEAARTMGASEWEVFWDVTFPSIRLALLYGITLCNARAVGEFGAVSVVSGNIVGQTQTLTLYVDAAYKDYNTQGAFSAALLLSVFAVITLVVKTILEDEQAKQLSYA